ncbi:MAG: TadE/TadG family type IV pilus assembly protein [Candidatus Sulfotelmatobacter sp.]
MTARRLLRAWKATLYAHFIREDNAAQILEFALSVPLLVLFVIGIFDFSGALALKHKLEDAAREGARVAAADPAGDLGNASGLPVSISDAYQVVDNYLISEKIPDCGLQGTSPAPASGGLTWQSPALTGCQGGTGLVLTINRGGLTNPDGTPCTSTQTSGQTTTYVVNSCVTIVYPYTWQFTSIGSFFGKFVGPTTIKTTATAFSQN